MNPVAEKGLWALGLLAAGGAVVAGVAFVASKPAAPAPSAPVPQPSPTKVSSTPAVPGNTIQNVAPPTPVPVLQGNQTINLDVNTPTVTLHMNAGSDLTIAAPSGGVINSVNGISVGGPTWALPGSELATGSQTLTVVWVPTTSAQQFSYTTTVLVTAV